MSSPLSYDSYKTATPYEDETAERIYGVLDTVVYDDEGEEHPITVKYSFWDNGIPTQDEIEIEIIGYSGKVDEFEIRTEILEQI